MNNVINVKFVSSPGDEVRCRLTSKFVRCFMQFMKTFKVIRGFFLKWNRGS